MTFYNNICLNTVTVISPSSKKLNDGCSSWSPKAFFHWFSRGEKILYWKIGMYCIKVQILLWLNSPSMEIINAATEASGVNTAIKFGPLDSTVRKKHPWLHSCGHFWTLGRVLKSEIQAFVSTVSISSRFFGVAIVDIIMRPVSFLLLHSCWKPALISVIK